jgi:uncharacterized protein involved in exopolysaccharide biosynthesis
MAQTTPEYSFRVIDPAMPPRHKQWPRPALLIAFGIFAGALLWLTVEAALHALRKSL